MQRSRICSITLLTPPPIVLLDDLFVTPLRRTSGITKRLVLDKVDGGPGGKVFSLVRRAHVLVLDLTDRLDLVWSNGLSSTTGSSTHARVGIDLVGDVVALCIEPKGESVGVNLLACLNVHNHRKLSSPSLESMSLLDIRMNSHRARTKHRQ